MQKRKEKTNLPHFQSDADCRTTIAQVRIFLLPHKMRFFPQLHTGENRLSLAGGPRYDFKQIIGLLRAGQEFKSLLAQLVGSKGYHDRKFSEGPYPV